MPGGANIKYPIWLRCMLDKYDDIDEVFVQSTYWNRFLLSCSKKLDVGDDTKPDLYLDNDQPKDDLIHRYTDHRITDDYIEFVEKPRTQLYQEFKGFKFHDSLIDYNFGLFHEKYSYTKLWHEMITPLQYKEFCSNLVVIDTMLKEKDIKWYLWTINERVYMPNNTDYFVPLSCVKAPMSVERYLKETENLDIETDHYRIDGEHYIKEVHNKIATDYFGYLKGASNKQNA
tara:strand:- start:338 stop:1027 length:690 start_codon:yes stop_codon:yes gene_type:complete